jgi:hypothetical protein
MKSKLTTTVTGSRLRILIVAVAVVAAAAASVATPQKASAASGGLASGPGVAGLTYWKQVHAATPTGFYGRLELGSGFTVTPSPSAIQYTQDITIAMNVWKWNGYAWGFVQTVRSTIRTYPGQNASFPPLDVIVSSSGYYSVTVDESWKYTNGVLITSKPWYYSASTDYVCDGLAAVNGTCVVGAGWVQMLVGLPT